MSDGTSAHEAAARTFRRRATELDGVDELYVFGPVARGDTDEESDLAERSLAPEELTR